MGDVRKRKWVHPSEESRMHPPTGISACWREGAAAAMEEAVETNRWVTDGQVVPEAGLKPRSPVLILNKTPTAQEMVLGNQ